MFRDRVDAGTHLGQLLVSYAGRGDVVVLGIPRGGVVVAAQVAKALRVPLDVIVVRKIGAPGNPEYAVGAVDGEGHVFRNVAAAVSEEYLRSQVAFEQREIVRREALYRSGRSPLALGGMTAVIVDDGIATGFTALAAVESARARGASSVVLAVPVVASDSERMLAGHVEAFVAVDRPANMWAVGQFYRDFGQTTDDEVRAAMQDAAPPE